LAQDYQYVINGEEVAVSGDQLMNYGLNIPVDLVWGDFRSKFYRLKAIGTN
jgi:alpha-galactosidase